MSGRARIIEMTTAICSDRLTSLRQELPARRPGCRALPDRRTRRQRRWLRRPRRDLPDGLLTSSPRLMRSASASERATVVVTWISTSGCTAMVILCWPMVLIGASSSTCWRVQRNAILLQRRHDVAHRHRAVKLAGFRRLTDDDDVAAFDLLGDLAGFTLGLNVLGLEIGLMPSYFSRFSLVARSAL